MLEKKKEKVREKYSIWKKRGYAREKEGKGERKVYCMVKNITKGPTPQPYNPRSPQTNPSHQQ